jgi:hypothetical protein
MNKIHKQTILLNIKWLKTRDKKKNKKRLKILDNKEKIFTFAAVLLRGVHIII